MPSDEMTAILEMMAEAPPPADSVEEQRAGLEASTGALDPPTGTEIELIEFDDFDAEWIRGPGADGEGAVLYLHGGGYAIGSIRTHRSLAARLSEQAALPVLLIGYRLAPEHPYPAGLEDALVAYRWLLDRGFAADQLTVAGDSAGGGLAMATLLALRDDDSTDLPAAAALLSPWVDLTLSGASMDANADRDPMVSREGLATMAGWYVDASDVDADHPHVSPVRADLSGLPSLLIQVGEPETLLDDATRLAERARSAGTDADLEIWPEVFHVWQASAGMTPEGDEALAKVGAFLAAAVKS